jgi:hypothetical protein
MQYPTQQWLVLLVKQHMRRMRQQEMLRRVRAARYTAELELKLQALEEACILPFKDRDVSCSSLFHGSVASCRMESCVR